MTEIENAVIRLLQVTLGLLLVLSLVGVVLGRHRRDLVGGIVVIDLYLILAAMAFCALLLAGPLGLFLYALLMIGATLALNTRVRP